MIKKVAKNKRKHPRNVMEKNGQMKKWKSELYHHGVLGMKWGVRRYQNYDGTYTKKGLEHYNKSVENYKLARDTRKAAQFTRVGTNRWADISDPNTGEVRLAQFNKKEIKELKRREKAAKTSMKKNYKQLKQDYKADHGKDLYAKGVRITDNARKAAMREIGVVLASNIAGIAVDKLTKGEPAAYIRGKGYVTAGYLVQKYALIGGTALNTTLAVRDQKQNNQLRAYYGHSSKYAD